MTTKICLRMALVALCASAATCTSGGGGNGTGAAGSTTGAAGGGGSSSTGAAGSSTAGMGTAGNTSGAAGMTTGAAGGGGSAVAGTNGGAGTTGGAGAAAGMGAAGTGMAGKPADGGAGATGAAGAGGRPAGTCSETVTRTAPPAGKESFKADPSNTKFPFAKHWIGSLGNPTAVGITGMADFDHDGDLDFASGQRGGPMWWWEYCTADHWVQHMVGTGHNSPGGGNAADVDRDGWEDLIAGDS
jgi:hypothetical protein